MQPEAARRLRAYVNRQQETGRTIVASDVVEQMIAAWLDQQGGWPLNAGIDRLRMAWPAEKQCVTCLFYEDLDKGMGRCHRFPPVLERHELSEESANGFAFWDFPETESDWWCGEWRSRDLLQ